MEGDPTLVGPCGRTLSAPHVDAASDRDLFAEVSALLVLLTVGEREAFDPDAQAIFSQSSRLLARMQTRLQAQADVCAALSLENRTMTTVIADTQRALIAHSEAADEARHRARHDNLTGLANREYFTERLQSALTPMITSDGVLGVLYLDLDNFKAVNDQHGHPVGDELLKIIAARLRQTLRLNDMVSRFGGDEFACLLVGFLDSDHMLEMAARLFEAIRTPVQVGDLELEIRASIGLAVSPRHGISAEQLLRNADRAMFHAKRGRLSYACADALNR